MNDGHDMRRSFRITESVFLKYEVLSDLEFNEGLDHRKIRRGLSEGVNSRLMDIESRFSEALYVLDHESERVTKCLQLLNEKLNTVIDHLPELRKSKSALARQPSQTCEISGEGMAFATDKPLNPGTKIALRFLLASDNRYVETFCRVVRQIDDFDYVDDVRPYAVAVEFHDMIAAQKEILIQHLFNRESETLRMRRLKLEATS